MQGSRFVGGVISFQAGSRIYIVPPSVQKLGCQVFYTMEYMNTAHLSFPSLFVPALFQSVKSYVLSGCVCKAQHRNVIQNDKALSRRNLQVHKDRTQTATLKAACCPHVVGKTKDFSVPLMLPLPTLVVHFIVTSCFWCLSSSHDSAFCLLIHGGNQAALTSISSAAGASPSYLDVLT